jgi:TetR/AcrR family transcriptional repressor of nem operon
LLQIAGATKTVKKDLACAKEVLRVRVSKEQAAENRTRILGEAARLFRERGLTGVGVDALSEAAGLTHGGLYSQFGSKDRLITEALTHALANGALGRLPEMPDATPREKLAAIVTAYLSPDHRDRAGKGCALAALGCEIPRQGLEVRRIFTDGLRKRMDVLASLLPGRRRAAREDEALAALATLVGALILSRAVSDNELSDRILAASAAQLTGRTETPA